MQVIYGVRFQRSVNGFDFRPSQLSAEFADGTGLLVPFQLKG